MGDDYWQPTAEMFQQLFSKPKMTEKLLSRPPFRYIHDIFTATLGATGFGEGLYDEKELDAKSINDKDAKILFLEKLIALVQMAAGEEIPVKPGKIVAGQEAEQTNIFLQYLFKVATSGIDSGPIVAEILGEGGDDGGGQQQEEDDGADEEEEARRAAEEEEERKRQKRAAKKKQVEEEQQRQKQQEDADKKRQAKEDAERKKQAEADKKAREQQEAEAAKLKAKKPKKQEEPQPPPKQTAIIEEGQDDDDDQNIMVEDDNEMNAGIDINEVDPESKFGRKAMAQLRAQEEEEEADRNLNDEPTGGIKLGKIGRRSKKKAGGVERSEPQKKVLQTEAPKRTFGGYSEDDIEYLRKSIQALCQATNPLGKSIDFVTEDIDSMVKEYEHWKLDFAESQAKLEEQQRITEQTIQPLQDVTLAQLEERIREEKSKIQNIRSQIIRNDNTIQNLLQSVISSG